MAHREEEAEEQQKLLGSHMKHTMHAENVSAGPHLTYLQNCSSC